MLTQRNELFAPSQHYQEALSAESRRVYREPMEGRPMPEEVKVHLEAMLDQAAKEVSLDPCRLLLQYATGFIGHAVMSRQCTMEERKHYWNRVDEIRQLVADREYARNTK